MSSERIKLPNRETRAENSVSRSAKLSQRYGMPSQTALQRFSRWVVDEVAVRLGVRNPDVAPSASPDEIRQDIQAWENEGGAIAVVHGQDWYRFGKRIESDGTWTIYHVFSGVPAKLGTWKMNGLKAPVAERALHIINTPSKKGEN
jgi:hypothetical protein